MAALLEDIVGVAAVGGHGRPAVGPEEIAKATGCRKGITLVASGREIVIRSPNGPQRRH